MVHVISNTLLARCASCKKHLMHDTCKARQALWTKKSRLVTTALVEPGKIRCTSNACGCVSTANGALLGLKPHSGESLRIARRINCLRLSPIDDFSPSERPAVCSKGRKGAHKWTQQRQEQSEGTEQKKGGAGSKMRAGGERRSERQGENGINTNGDEREQSMAEEVRTQGRVA